MKINYYQGKHQGTTKIKTAPCRELPTATIVAVSLFSIAILIISTFSTVIAYVHSIPPTVKSLSDVRHQLPKNLQHLIEKSSGFTSLFLYLYIALLHFIVLFTESYRPLLSLIISLLWPIADLYGVLVITILFIALFFMDIPQLPHHNLRTVLSQIHGT